MSYYTQYLNLRLCFAVLNILNIFSIDFITSIFYLILVEQFNLIFIYHTYLFPTILLCSFSFITVVYIIRSIIIYKIYFLIYVVILTIFAYCFIKTPWLKMHMLCYFTNSCLKFYKLYRIQSCYIIKMIFVILRIIFNYVLINTRKTHIQ